MNLQGRNLLKETDLSAAEFLYLVDLGGQLRLQKRMGLRNNRLAGRNIALIFEKTSTRTRSAFEVAAHDEGAHVTYLGPEDSQLGDKESVKDTARVLGRMFDGIEYRGAAQETVETLGAWAGVPVWNGLTDDWHPTQVLADIMTMRDHASHADRAAETEFPCRVDGPEDRGRVPVHRGDRQAGRHRVARRRGGPAVRPGRNPHLPAGTMAIGPNRLSRPRAR
jgi:ornithine carbamoyltransferase